MGSGPGSFPPFNATFVSFFNDFIKTHSDIKTVVDIGCGDGQTAKHFDISGKTYIGCDVSSFALDKIKKVHFSGNIRFQLLDATYGTLPDGDVAVVKDVLQHLSNESVSGILEKLDKYRYVIMQNDVYKNQLENKNIENGGWRPLDITTAPFFAGKYTLTKYYTEYLYVPLNIFRAVLLLSPINKGIFLKN